MQPPSGLCDHMPQPSPETGQNGRREERVQSVPPATDNYDWTLSVSLGGDKEWKSKGSFSGGHRPPLGK